MQNDLDKKIKKLKRRKRLTLTLIIIIAIILSLVIAINMYKKSTTKNNEENDEVVGVDKNGCNIIKPTIENDKYTIKTLKGKCVSVTLNNNFKLLYDSTYEKYYLNVNNNFIKKENNYKNIVFYVSDDVIITKNESSKNYMYILKDGSFKEFIFKENMCQKGDPEIENNKIIINATSNCNFDNEEETKNDDSTKNNWYITKDNYIKIMSSSLTTEKSLTIDQITEKYNIPRDFAVEFKYTYEPNDMSNPKIETTKTISQLFDEMGPSVGFYSGN